MPSFREMRKIRPVGFDCHHVIPGQVLQIPSLAITIGKARAAGFDPNDFGSNGMFLPNVEANAVAFQLPLHRGPHPDYNLLVAERIAAMAGRHPVETRNQFLKLQHALKTGLRMSSIMLGASHRDPFRSDRDFRKIDGAIELLWSRTEPED